MKCVPCYVTATVSAMRCALHITYQDENLSSDSEIKESSSGTEHFPSKKAFSGHNGYCKHNMIIIEYCSIYCNLLYTCFLMNYLLGMKVNRHFQMNV